MVNKYGRGTCIYVSPRAGTAYMNAGYYQLRELMAGWIARAARRISPIRTDAPMAVETVLYEKPGQMLVHLLNYACRPPLPRTVGNFPDLGLGPMQKSWMTYDEIIPIPDIRVSVRTERQPQTVSLIPSRQELAFEFDGREASFVLPRLADAASVCLQF